MRNLFYLTKKKIQPVNIEPMFLEYKELIRIDKTGFYIYINGTRGGIDSLQKKASAK